MPPLHAWLPQLHSAGCAHRPAPHNPPVCRPAQVAPYLRGEWDTSKVGLLAPPEQRIQLAVDALLGAVPIWFKVRRFGVVACFGAVLLPWRVWMMACHAADLATCSVLHVWDEL